MAANQRLIKDYARVCKENERLQTRVQELEREKEQINKKAKKQNSDNREEIQSLKRMLKNRDQKIVQLTEQHQQDQERNDQLETKVKVLEEQVAKLMSLLNTNSDNSSQSTGVDQNKPRSEKKKSVNEYNGRRSGKRKRGGQPNHKGKSLSKQDLKRLMQLNNVIVEIKDEGDVSLSYDSEYELDFFLTIKITERRLHHDSNTTLRAHRSSIFYGKTFKALCVLLNTEFNLSYHKIGKFIDQLTHGAIHPSAGSIYTYCHEFAEKSEKKVRELTLDLLNEPILGTDSTVMIVNGVRRNIRIYTTSEKALYQAMQTKTLDEIKETTFLPLYKGILLHDHEAAMFHFGEDNAKCLVHEQRYIRKIQDITGNQWSFDMEKFFQKLMHERKEALKQGKTKTDQDEIENYHRTYQDILKEGFEQNKTTKFSWAKNEEKATLNRLKNYEHNVLLFLEDFNIMPHNNLCESRLRVCKAKQRITGGFKTFKGLENYANSLSAIRDIELNEPDFLEAVESYFD